MNPFTEHIEALQQANTEVEFFKFQKAFHTHSRIIILGNGGFFLTFSEKNTLKIPYECVKITVEPSGVTGKIL